MPSVDWICVSKKIVVRSVTLAYFNESFLLEYKYTASVFLRNQLNQMVDYTPYEMIKNLRTLKRPSLSHFNAFQRDATLWS